MAQEGRLYHNDNSGAVYLALDGFLRHVPNPQTYDALFRVALSADHMVRIQDSDINVGGLNVGLPLLDGAQLILEDSGKVYLTDNGLGVKIKRHVSDAGQMDKYQFAWEKLVKMTDDEAAVIPSGHSI
jgi:hypothetical protein